MKDLPTLYRLADGTQGDPGECSPDDKGVLRHNNGVPVVIDSDGKPVEIKREAEVNKTALAAKLGDDAEASAKADAVSAGKMSADEARSDAGPAADAKAPADDGTKNETL